MKYYAGIMQDNNDLLNDHVTVSKRYINTILCILIKHYSPNIMSHDFDRLIKRLRKN